MAFESLLLLTQLYTKLSFFYYNFFLDYIPPLTLFGVDFIFDALVYKQSQMLSTEEFGGGQRVFFNMGDFASANNLCGPVGGLQMRIYFSVVVK